MDRVILKVYTVSLYSQLMAHTLLPLYKNDIFDLGIAHKPIVYSFKINILEKARPSLFPP